MRRPRGFTLWELLCTVGIAGITLAAGIPAFRTVVLDARLTADVNGWILAIQLARVDVVEMVMRVRRRIVELSRRIDVDRAQQPLLTEQVQRVVDGRLRDLESARADRRDDLLGGQMLWARQRQQRDIYPLRSRQDAALAEQCCCLIACHISIP